MNHGNTWLEHIRGWKKKGTFACRHVGRSRQRLLELEMGLVFPIVIEVGPMEPNWSGRCWAWERWSSTIFCSGCSSPAGEYADTMPLTCKTHTSRLALRLRIQSLFTGRPKKIKVSKLIFLENVHWDTTNGAHKHAICICRILIVFWVEYNSKTENITTTRFHCFSVVLLLWAKFQCWWHDKLYHHVDVIFH
jgi:hypothetical protein